MPRPSPQKYPIAGYVKLPYALQPFVQLPYLDHVVVVAKPSGDVSGGLENYREVRGWRAATRGSGMEAPAGQQPCGLSGSVLQDFPYFPKACPFSPSPAWLLQSVSKPERAAAPIFAVIDTPGKVVKDKGYLWIEVGAASCWQGRAVPQEQGCCLVRRDTCCRPPPPTHAAAHHHQTLLLPTHPSAPPNHPQVAPAPAGRRSRCPTSSS